MGSLYNITNKFLEYYYNQDEFIEEDKKIIEQALTEELENKSLNVIKTIRNKDLLIEDIDTEIKRLQTLKKTIKSKTEMFKELTQEQMKKLGIERQETPLGTLSIRKNPISVEIIDEEKVSRAFKREKVTYTVDKTSIKKHFLDTGEIVEGVKIITDKTSLSIK